MIWPVFLPKIAKKEKRKKDNTRIISLLSIWIIAPWLSLSQTQTNDSIKQVNQVIPGSNISVASSIRSSSFKSYYISTGTLSDSYNSALLMLRNMIYLGRKINILKIKTESHSTVPACTKSNPSQLSRWHKLQVSGVEHWIASVNTTGFTPICNS